MKKQFQKGTGGLKSKYDIRTFSYIPDKANYKGGVRYKAEDIEDQFHVGICTAIATTQHAKKNLGIKMSADFQYLLQKKFIDKDWNEGSSLFSAMQVASKYGFLPEKYWTFTKLSDRKLSYIKYIKKLQAVSDKDIEKLLKISAKYKIAGYAGVPVTRDLMANAIDESVGGILTRFALGKEWWTPPIEPLRAPVVFVSGHAIITSNYTGNSFRVANTWGDDWADLGTAYYLHRDYKPTEAWIVYFNETKAIAKQKKARKGIKGKVLNQIQKVINLIQ